MDNQFILMKDNRFAPLFVTQFLGAFNDNLYKTSISVLIAYGLWNTGGLKPEIIVSLAAALFILPFILFAPLAGQLADKFDKSHVMRWIKLFEILIVVGAGAGLWLHSIPVLLLVLFAFGTHSAFFSPSKFSILPQHLQKDELIGGNALINTGTYLAILLGNIIGGLLALTGAGIAAVIFILFVCAVQGCIASWFIPKAPAPSPGLKLNYNIVAEAKIIFGFAHAQPAQVFPAMVGCSWFFFVGAMVLSQLPNYTNQVLGVDNFVLTFFMAVFSLGVGLGGLVNNRLLKSKIDMRFVPLAAVVLAIFAIDLCFTSRVYHSVKPLLGDYLITLPDFLSHITGWHIVFDLFAISAAAGVYVVPLKALVQHRTAPELRARVIAAGSLLDAVFILSSSIVAIFMLSIGFAIEHLFLVVALGSLFMAFYLGRRGPSQSLKNIFRRQYE